MERGESVVCCAEEETLSAQATLRGTRGQVAPLRLSTSTFQRLGSFLQGPRLLIPTYSFHPSWLILPSLRFTRYRTFREKSTPFPQALALSQGRNLYA